NLMGGDDILTVSNANGVFDVPADVHYNGGDGTDLLRVLGQGTVFSTTTPQTIGGQGDIVTEGPRGLQRVAYQSVESPVNAPLPTPLEAPLGVIRDGVILASEQFRAFSGSTLLGRDVPLVGNIADALNGKERAGGEERGDIVEEEAFTEE